MGAAVKANCPIHGDHQGKRCKRCLPARSVLIPEDLLKPLLAGQPVEVKLTKSRVYRRGVSYPVKVGRRWKGARSTGHTIILTTVQRSGKVGWQLGGILDRQINDRLLAASGPPDDTLSPAHAMREEFPAISEDEQEDMSKEARKDFDERRRLERLRREKQSLSARIGIAQKVAAVQGVNISPHVRRLERQLLELERELYGDKGVAEAA